MNLSRRRLLYLMLGCLFVVVGCSDDPVPPEPDSPLPPDPPDPMIKFETAYSNMDIAHFTNMLHDDFKMILASDTLEEWGWAADFYFDKSTMVAGHAHMFAGEIGTDAGGNSIHPIDSIAIQILELYGAWEKIPDDDFYFGGFDGWMGHHSVNFEFYDAELSQRFEVNGLVTFFLTAVKVDGKTTYIILGIRQVPGGKASESRNWGDVISLYR
jgi:hypothetical protein